MTSENAEKRTAVHLNVGCGPIYILFFSQETFSNWLLYSWA